MKPHLTIEEQVNHLKKRGLHIKDETNFGLFLLNNNYYRVSGYFNPFLIEAEGGIQSYFKPGTSEIQIMNSNFSYKTPTHRLNDRSQRRPAGQRHD